MKMENLSRHSLASKDESRHAYLKDDVGDVPDHETESLHGNGKAKSISNYSFSVSDIINLIMFDKKIR
jgi:hypothetical protein